MKAFVRYATNQFGLSKEVSSKLKAILNWIPVVCIFGIYAWSYYYYVLMWIFQKVIQEDRVLGVAFFVMYHLIGGMSLWSFYICSFSKPSDLTLEFETCDRPLDYSSEDDYFPVPGKMRYCLRCKIMKPERTCHCSWCDICVPKMDHHCPWVGNCVGQHNYKSFILMLFYLICFGAYVLVSIYTYGRFFANYLYSIILIGFSVTLGCSLLLSFHIFLLFTNTTTIECGVRMAECTLCSLNRYICFPDHVYNKGMKENFISVFGTKKKYWLIPLNYF